MGHNFITGKMEPLCQKRRGHNSKRSRLSSGRIRSAVVFLAAAVLFLGLPLSPSLAADFSTPVQLTSATYGHNQSYPMIAVDSDGFSHITWYGEHPTEGGADQIWYADNTTGSWSAPKQLTFASEDSYQKYPQIALDSDGFSHITWMGFHPIDGAPSQIWYADNTSGSWSAPVPVTSATGANGQHSPQIALDSNNNSHLTWYGSHPATGDPYQIWYADNTSGSWSAPVQVTSASGSDFQYKPQIAVDSSCNSHIAWYGYSGGAPYQIWYADNTSGSWSTPEQITSATGSFSQYSPQIAVDTSGNSHLAWKGYHPTDGDPEQIWYADDTSGSWSGPEQITSATGTNSQVDPQIAVDSNNDSHIAWFGRHPDDGAPYQVWYADNTTGSWPSPTQVTSATGSNDQRYVQMALDLNNNSHLTWFGDHPTEGGSNQIWYSDNTSGSWTSQVRITPAAGESSFAYPQIGLDPGGNSHITWSGNYTSGGYPSQVWYAGPVSQPTVTTGSATGVSGEDATLNGEITGTGGESADERGFRWRIEGTSAWTDWSETGSFEAGTFNHPLAELESDTTYEYQATVHNSAGTAFGTTEEFTTSDDKKILGSKAWVVPEGSTRGGFDTFVLIQNPGSDPASAEVTFATEDGEQDGTEVQVPAQSRVTLRLADYLPEEWSISTMIVSEAPVVVERSMYWNSNLTANPCEMISGHANLGVVPPLDESSQPDLSEPTDRYFPEGSTAGFDTWILLFNPSQEEVEAKVTLMDENGPAVEENVTVPALSRKTLHLNELLPGRDQVATRVESETFLATERSMYWDPNAAQKQASEMTGGHATSGSDGASPNWYIAEGSTGGGFDTYVLLQNPGDTAADVRAVFMNAGGTANTLDLTMEPQSRSTIKVSDYVPDEFEVSTSITSDVPVVAERSMYWDKCETSVPSAMKDGHSTVGETGTGMTWMVPEGSTGGGFDTFILIANTGEAEASADVVFMTADGPQEPVSITIPAGSRYTLRVSDYIPGNYQVSTQVTGDSDIVVERSMYWDLREKLSEGEITVSPYECKGGHSANALDP